MTRAVPTRFLCASFLWERMMNWNCYSPTNHQGLKPDPLSLSLCAVFFLGEKGEVKSSLTNQPTNQHTKDSRQLHLLSVRIFFWERMVSWRLCFSTSDDCVSLSWHRRTSSLCCRSHSCCSSPISCCRTSSDFTSELIWISSGPSSTPWSSAFVCETCLTQSLPERHWEGLRSQELGKEGNTIHILTPPLHTCTHTPHLHTCTHKYSCNAHT